MNFQKRYIDIPQHPWSHEAEETCRKKKWYSNVVKPPSQLRRSFMILSSFWKISSHILNESSSCIIYMMNQWDDPKQKGSKWWDNPFKWMNKCDIFIFHQLKTKLAPLKDSSHVTFGSKCPDIACLCMSCRGVVSVTAQGMEILVV